MASLLSCAEVVLLWKGGYIDGDLGWTVTLALSLSAAMASKQVSEDQSLKREVYLGRPRSHVAFETHSFYLCVLEQMRNKII